MLDKMEIKTTENNIFAENFSVKIFLHVGCGTKRKEQTTRGFASPEWQEVRLDIDPAAKPDIIASITDMSIIPDGSMDALFSSHNIEHLYAHEVTVALKEFWRVLKPEGFAVITCPDIQSVSELVAQDKLLEPCYVSPAGPIAPIDILWGHRPSLASGNYYMAHKVGFTQSVLVGILRHVGFASIASMRRGSPFFDIWALASKSQRSEEEMRKLASLHFPL